MYTGFNAIVEFSHLTKEDLNQIVDLMLNDVNDTLAKKDIVLTVMPAAKAWLIDEGYDEAMHGSTSIASCYRATNP